MRGGRVWMDGTLVGVLAPGTKIAIERAVERERDAIRERALGPAWSVTLGPVPISPLTIARIARLFGVPPRLLGDRPARAARRRRAEAMRAWTRRGRGRRRR